MLDKRENASIEKSDGSVLGPYDAIFTGTVIVIDDPAADVEEDDVVLRKLPNGKYERSIVTQATYYSEGVGNIGAHYQLKFRKGKKPEPSAQNINISGAQSVQIGDYNTQNIVNSFDALVQKIEATNVDAAQKQEAKSLLASFLEHPATVAVLGAAASSLVS